MKMTEVRSALINGWPVRAMNASDHEQTMFAGRIVAYTEGPQAVIRGADETVTLWRTDLIERTDELDPAMHERGRWGDPKREAVRALSAAAVDCPFPEASRWLRERARAVEMKRLERDPGCTATDGPACKCMDEADHAGIHHHCSCGNHWTDTCAKCGRIRGHLGECG